MTEIKSSALTAVEQAQVKPALQNPAVAHCCEFWETTLHLALNQGKSLVQSRVAAHKAYQQALPPLIGLENIQNFIACVAHGMLKGSILHQHGTTLLYAAQVAKSMAVSTGRQPKTRAE